MLQLLSRCSEVGNVIIVCNYILSGVVIFPVGNGV
jgi:hypothetical protein